MADRVSDPDGALERFCAEAWPVLVGALGHQFGDRWLAEELAQEALIRAADRWATVSRLRSPIGWTFRVGVNLGRSRLRRRRAARRAYERAGGRDDHWDADVADRVAVREALASLSPRQREAVVLRYFLRLSAEDAADLLGTTAGAVRSSTHRALGALRDLLDTDLDAADEPGTDARARVVPPAAASSRRRVRSGRGRERGGAASRDDRRPHAEPEARDVP